MQAQSLTTIDSNKQFSIMQWLSKYSFIVIFVILLILSTTLSSVFLTSKNIFNILLETSILGVVSVGTTFVILIAGIDLSIGGVIALSSMVSAVLSNWSHGSLFVAIISALLTGGIVGIVNGLATVYGKVPSFVVTLATGTIASGIALLITGGQPVYNLSKSFLSVGSAYLGPVPVLALIWIVISILAFITLRFTPFGRQIHAMGDNNFAAFLAGIRVNSYTILIFVIAGLLSGLGGFLYSSWVTVGYPDAGSNYTLEAIAAVVIGGTSLFGGIGGVGGTFLGSLMLVIFTNIFNLVGLPAVLQMIGYGCLILFALLLNQWLQKYNQD